MSYLGEVTNQYVNLVSHIKAKPQTWIYQTVGHILAKRPASIYQSRRSHLGQPTNINISESGDSSVVRAPDSSSKDLGFLSQLSVLTLIPVSVPSARVPGHSAKCAAGRLQVSK